MQPDDKDSLTTQTKGERADIPCRYLFEVFLDECYFGMWAVRTKGEKRWGHCYHLPSKEEAEGLAQELSRFEWIKGIAAETHWDASDQMDAIDSILSSNA